MNKSLLLYIAFFSVALFGVFVLAQTPIANSLIVVNTYSCSETDGGLNYLTAGSITGSFWWNITGNSTNSTSVGTYNGTFTDTCVTNTTLVEVACGGSINPAYNTLAGAVYVNCAIPATNVTNSTYQGRCIANRCI